MIDRRGAMIGATAAAAFLLPAKGFAQMTSQLVADTQYGRVRGSYAHGGTMAFKGIRYATAARFMPPRPPEPWSGVVEATQFGASAPQSNPEPPPGPPYVITAQIPPPAGASPPVRLPENEDCLFLNVWTAALRDDRKRPVMVWLHGGFFYGGSGSTVDGSRLAARGDVVVVSLNHRLNAFGFSHLANFAGSEFSAAGNAGMLDIIAALEWVRDNIAAFGGDPDRVMVFGASGGGMKTSILMASPRAAGLVHRAAMQSGPGLRFMEPVDASSATAMLLAELAIPTAAANDLARVPVVDLLRAYHAVSARLKPARFIDLPSFSPVLDDTVLPRHPFSPDAATRTRDIPMLIGWNAQEMSFFMGSDPAAFTLDRAGLVERSAALLGNGAADILAVYRQRHADLNPSQLYIRLLSDYSVMLPTLAQADRKVALGGAPTFAYRFDFASPALGGKLGAMHTLEGAFVFDTAAATPHLTGGSARAADLGRLMSNAWANFAISGDPNGQDLPLWPTYQPETSPIMLFGAQPVLAIDPVGAERAALASLLGV